jgi:hypothetical protein
MPTEELRERKALTDAIVKNLETINEDGNDLDELDSPQPKLSFEAKRCGRTSDRKPPHFLQGQIVYGNEIHERIQAWDSSRSADGHTQGRRGVRP